MRLRATPVEDEWHERAKQRQLLNVLHHATASLLHSDKTMNVFVCRQNQLPRHGGQQSRSSRCVRSLFACRSTPRLHWDNDRMRRLCKWLCAWAWCSPCPCHFGHNKAREKRSCWWPLAWLRCGAIDKFGQSIISLCGRGDNHRQRSGKGRVVLAFAKMRNA